MDIELGSGKENEKELIKFINKLGEKARNSLLKSFDKHKKWSSFDLLRNKTLKNIDYEGVTICEYRLLNIAVRLLGIRNGETLIVVMGIKKKKNETDRRILKKAAKLVKQLQIK